MDWRDFPKKKNKIAIIGFAETRSQVPWDDPDMEFFPLNEEYNFPWIKKWDRWMQIHPKWDFTRNTNNNDPNHYLWLQNKSGKCVQCKGGGVVIPMIILDKTKTRADAKMECPGCKGTGMYTPPESRGQNFPIYMMKSYPEIPNSVAYPLNEVSKALIPDTNHQKDYFTSSASLMLGISYLLGYKDIYFYGFEMGADTEYHYQRAGFEYLIGLVQGKGVNVHIPAASTLLTGILYGYKSMKQGYRQNLEMRLRFLARQLEEERNDLAKMEGQKMAFEQLEGLGIEEIKGRLINIKSDIEDQLGLLNGLQFSMSEVQNLTKMYDNYFYAGTESGEDDDIQMTEGKVNNFVGVRYKAVKHDDSK